MRGEHLVLGCQVPPINTFNNNLFFYFKIDHFFPLKNQSQLWPRIGFQRFPYYKKNRQQQSPFVLTLVEVLRDDGWKTPHLGGCHPHLGG